MSDSLRSKLPPVYSPLFADVFDGPEVKEPRATCGDCAMCDKGTGASIEMDFFSPDVKCCTYHPNLPNFLVGAILADPSPDLAEGQRRIRERLTSRIAVSPAWISAPKKYQLLVSASRDSNVFGRAKSLLCPYYADEGGGKCTIWRHRDGVCSTFFCKYDGGRLGFAFWTALKMYLIHVEGVLATHTMAKVDPALKEPKKGPLKLDLRDLENLPPKDEDYAAMWGSWIGREAEMYIAAYEVVRTMDRATFASLIDDTKRGTKLLEDIRKAWSNLTSTELPKFLVRNRRMQERRIEGGVVVTTYNDNDSFLVEQDLFDVLAMLKEGKTVDENLTALASQGIELTPELIHHLFKHGVLVPPPKATVCSTSDGPA